MEQPSSHISPSLLSADAVETSITCGHHTLSLLGERERGTISHSQSRNDSHLAYFVISLGMVESRIRQSTLFIVLAFKLAASEK